MSWWNNCSWKQKRKDERRTDNQRSKRNGGWKIAYKIKNLFINLGNDNISFNLSFTHLQQYKCCTQQPMLLFKTNTHPIPVTNSTKILDTERQYILFHPVVYGLHRHEPGVGGRILQWDRSGLNPSGSGQRPVGDSCEYGTEHSGSREIIN